MKYQIMEYWKSGILEEVEEWKNGRMERLSELKSENLMSRLWDGQWERIMIEEYNDRNEILLILNVSLFITVIILWEEKT